MIEKYYRHSIDIENEEYCLSFATDNEELFKDMKMFLELRRMVDL